MSKRIYLPEENEESQANPGKEIEKPTESQIQKQENEGLPAESEK